MNAPAPPPARPATYQDVLDAPPNMVAEIVGGRLSLQARPAFRHSRAGTRLGARLDGPFDSAEGGWWLLDEPELHLGGDVLVPDLAGWRRERLPRLVEEGSDPPWLDLVPDWACEVLSPSTRRLDLTAKRDAYAREGLGHLWFVDPIARTLETFELRNGAWTLLVTLKDDEPVRLAPFAAVEWPLSALWLD